MREVFTGADGNLSSKRVFGAFLLMYAVLVNTLYIILPIDIPINIFELTKALAWTGAVMITGGVAENAFKK